MLASGLHSSKDPSNNRADRDCDQNIGNCPGFLPSGLPNWPDWRWNDTTTFVDSASSDLQVVAWHYYAYYGCKLAASPNTPCTPGLPPAAEALTTPRFLDRTAERAGRYSRLQQKSAPHAQTWLTATASGGLGGVPNVSNAFASSLWFLDSLGMVAENENSVYFRDEIFCGYDYFQSRFFEWSPYCIIELSRDGEINKVNPDFFPGLLFKRLAGQAVLRATVVPEPSFEYESKLRAYAFCGRDGRSTTTILVNLGSAPLNVTLAVGGAAQKSRTVWLLTAGDDLGLHSRRIRVNGRLMPDDGTAPSEAELAGLRLPAAGSTVALPGLSAALVADAHGGQGCP